MNALAGLDTLQLSFSPLAVFALQSILAVVIFGVALDLSFDDFGRLLRRPKPLVAGLTGQLLVLPLLTVGLVLATDPPASVALGLMITAACPGGNVANVLTHLSGGRTAVSMSLTTVSSLVSPITTPLIFAVLGGLVPKTAGVLRSVSVPWLELVFTIVVALLVPLLLGMWLRTRRPALAQRLEKPLKRFGIAVLALFIVLGLAANRGALGGEAALAVFGLVAAHNLLALLAGFGIATAFRLAEADRRAVTFENGVHNSALGLALVFTYYQGLGGMAVIAAWWGIWHLVTGGLLAAWWARRKPVATGAEAFAPARDTSR